MKTNLLIIAVVSILVSGCTTGTHMTKTYDDDIYFSPRDLPPVTMNPDEGSGKASKSDAGNQGIVMSQREKNADGTSTVNNNIYQPKDTNKNSDYQAYDMNHQNLAGSDTAVYYNDDSVKYVINNYYDDNNDMDFSTRINRFDRPYFYDPFFYNDWNYGFYSPFYSGYSAWGYDPYFSGGWGSPYGFYGGYNSPFAFGFGGYWGGGYGGYGYGGNGYGYGGYYNGYNNGYYGDGGYYGGGGGFSNNHEIVRRRPTDSNMPGGNNQNNVQNDNTQGRSRGSNLRDGSLGNSSDSKLPTGVNSNTWIQNGHPRGRVADASGNNVATKSATIVNNRRSNTTSGSQVQGASNSRTQAVRPNTTTSGNIRRSYEPSTTGRTYNQSKDASQGQNYTPSYNKPRIVNQSNYNNNSYTRPRTSDAGYQRAAVKSANTGGQNYSAPRSSSNMRQTYRSSSSYSSGSSNSSSGRSSGSTYSSPSNSGSTYSAPQRSSSSSGGGGSYNGGSSSGGSSGGSSGSSSGGGGGHRR